MGLEDEESGFDPDILQSMYDCRTRNRIKRRTICYGTHIWVLFLTIRLVICLNSLI